jgi:trans-aconitate 2-methyltransferase
MSVRPHDSWDPGQYDRFRNERSAPFHDLAGLLAPVDRPLVLDAGCGTGELTAWLHRELGAASTVGVDNSAAMLAEARARATATLTFRAGDIATLAVDEPVDVLLSNAALQWVPDHPAVLARWVASIRPGGRIAVQVPANADHPSHRVAHLVAEELAAEQSDAFGPPGTPPPPDPVVANVLRPAAYAELLHDLGLVDPHVRLQVYSHVLAHSADVVEWVKGTTLNRFKAVLAPDVFDRYLVAYRRRLLAELGDRAPYLYPFQRILFSARVRAG